MLTEPATIPPDDAVLTCGPAVWADLIGFPIVSPAEVLKRIEAT